MMNRLGNWYSDTRARVSSKSCTGEKERVGAREGGREEWKRERNVQMYVCVCMCAYVYPTSGVSVGKPQIISVAMVIPGTLQWKECAHVSEPTPLLVCALEHLVQTCLNTN